MSYRMIYEPGSRAEGGNSVIFRTLMTASFFVCFLWAVNRFWPEGREVLTKYLLPGEPALAQAAFSVLLDNLRHGMGMVESLTVFCREILYEIL